MMESFQTLELAVKGDARGLLAVIEGGLQCPFQIARVYWVYATKPGVRRGLHAHWRTRQMAVCVAGGCSFLMDDGTTRQVLRLDSPSTVLPIEPLVWHEMFDFTPDCVLLVMADAPYQEADYIRDYETFRSALKPH